MSRNSRLVEHYFNTILFKVRTHEHGGYSQLETKIAQWNRTDKFGRISANALAFGVLQSLADRDPTRMNNAEW